VTQSAEYIASNPYVPHWYGTSIRNIFFAVKGEAIHRELYRRFSDWHHWEIAGFVPLLQIDRATGGFQMSGSDHTLTRAALASAFQCLWQTLEALNEVLHLELHTELRCLYDQYVAIP
jgi:hypothetical protein